MLIFAEEDVDPFTLDFGGSNSNALLAMNHPTNNSSQQPDQRQQQQQEQPPPPLFTMQQLQLLQLQARQQIQQQQQQPLPNQLNQQPFNLNVNNCANNSSTINGSHVTNQSNNNPSPYMVLTQLPLQVTPFGQTVIDSSSSNHHQRNSLASTQQVMHEWAQILQPTPIGNEGVHGASNNGSLQMQQNISNDAASEAQSQSLMQQFLSQLGFGCDSNAGNGVNGNNNLAPVGSVPPQQTIPTRMEPVDPKRSNLGIFSDWFMPNNNNNDGKRKFSLVG